MLVGADPKVSVPIKLLPQRQPAGTHPRAAVPDDAQALCYARRRGGQMALAVPAVLLRNGDAAPSRAESLHDARIPSVCRQPSHARARVLEPPRPWCVQQKYFHPLIFVTVRMLYVVGL